MRGLGFCEVYDLEGGYLSWGTEGNQKNSL